MDHVSRPPRTRPLALAAIALVAGLVVGLNELDRLLPAAALLSIGAGLAAVLLRRPGLLIVATLLAIGTGGLIAGVVAEEQARADCRAGWSSGASVRVSGLAIGFLPADERGSVRFRPLSPAENDGCRWSGSLRVWTEGPVRPGAIYELTGTWQPSRRPGRWPRPPDRRGWITAKRVTLVQPPGFREHPFLYSRGVLAERLWHTYPRRWAPLAQALVLGQRETISPELYRRIARAGLAHLLAISGLHVGILAAAIFALARTARIGPRNAHLLTAALTFTYVLLIGAPASAVRAALMVSLWTLTRLAGRASSAFDVLGFTALCLLLVRPWSVLEPGFQLSFAGAAAVGYAYTEARRWRRLRRMPAIGRLAAISVVTSTATILLVAPITATHFGRITPAAVVGNLAAMPLLTLAMPALFLSALLTPWPELAAWPADAAIVVLNGIDLLARLLSGFSWGSIEIARPAALPALAYALLLVFGTHAFYGAWQRRRFILVVGLLVAAAVTWPAARARLAVNHLTVYVLDVGQGDAIAVATPKRHWLLVDSGPSYGDFNAGAQRVVPFLREHGARRLVALLTSHPDLDHVGGAPAVLDALEVERVIGSDRPTGQVGELALLRSIANGSSRWLHAGAGDTLRVDGVDLLFQHPGAIVPENEGATNAYSLVFRLQYGSFRMLFTGDVAGDVEDRLSVESADELRAQVLKVSHHGSASSTSRLFLSRVQPELAVISVGRSNLYGHPSPRLLLRLAARGIETRRTDRQGTLVIEAWKDGSWRLSSAAESGW